MGVVVVVVLVVHLHLHLHLHLPLDLPLDLHLHLHLILVVVVVVVVMVLSVLHGGGSVGVDHSIKVPRAVRMVCTAISNRSGGQVARLIPLVVVVVVVLVVVVVMAIMVVMAVLVVMVTLSVRICGLNAVENRGKNKISQLVASRIIHATGKVSGTLSVF